MILTDEEIEACAADDDGSDDMAFARAIEAAIMAKLASAELPEPATWGLRDFVTRSEKPLYTADQLRQAYAQGAAAQLAEKPSAWLHIGYMGEPTISRKLPEYGGGNQLTPLYTRRQA